MNYRSYHSGNNKNQAKDTDLLRWKAKESRKNTDYCWEGWDHTAYWAKDQDKNYVMNIFE